MAQAVKPNDSSSYDFMNENLGIKTAYHNFCRMSLLFYNESCIVIAIFLWSNDCNCFFVANGCCSCNPKVNWEVNALREISFGLALFGVLQLFLQYVQHPLRSASTVIDSCGATMSVISYWWYVVFSWSYYYTVWSGPGGKCGLKFCGPDRRRTDRRQDYANPSVRPSVILCFVALRVGVHG